MRIPSLLVLTLLAFCPLLCIGSHSYGGWIEYSYVDSLQYEFKVYIIVDPNSPAVQRQEIPIDYGDQSGIDSIRRIQINPPLLNNVQLYVFSGTHTYSSKGEYTISVTDPNRIGQIDNAPNSLNQPLYLETSIKTGEKNQSVTFPQTPHFFITPDSIFQHQINLKAFDSEGDRLVYELINAKGSQSNILSGYQIPTNASINNQSGMIEWQTSLIGRFLFTVNIKEVRQDRVISNTTIDFVIESQPTHSIPPLLYINPLFQKDSCGVNSITLSPADTLSIAAKALAIETSNSSEVNINGVFPQSNGISYNTVFSSPDSAIGSLIWITDSLDARCEPYFIYLRSTQTYQNKPSIATRDYALQVYILDSANRFCDTVCNSTAISVKNLDREDIIARIYPNPSADFIVIELGDNHENKLRLQLIDLQGRIIEETTIRNNQNKLTYQPNREVNGVYLLKLSSERGQITYRKVVFTH